MAASFAPLVDVVAFAPQYPSKARPGDAAEFAREARAWLRLHKAHLGVEPIPFDNTAPPRQRARAVAAALRGAHALGGPLRAVAFFCHGLRDSLQAGFASDVGRRPAYAPVGELATVLREVMTSAPILPLYACDAARDDDADGKDDLEGGPGGEGGFADALRDALIALDASWSWGGVIDAHAKAGHTTLNPHVRRFACSPLPHEVHLGMVGGGWIVDPTDRPRWRAWNAALGEPKKKGSMRLRFPSMTVAEIHAELDG